MRSMSSIIVSWASQNVPEKSGEYTLRPSTRTSSFIANPLLNPRTETAWYVPLMRATSTPGTSRRASGIDAAPERRMSSAVSTEIAAAVSDSRWGRLETEVISIFIRSSSPSSASAASLSAARTVVAMQTSATANGMRTSTTGSTREGRERRRTDIERGLSDRTTITNLSALRMGPLRKVLARIGVTIHRWSIGSMAVCRGLRNAARLLDRECSRRADGGSGQPPASRFSSSSRAAR